jgi:hypothetical protein
VAREAVGPDAADEQEEHLRQRARRQHVAEVGFRAGHVENGERSATFANALPTNEVDRPTKRSRNSR